MRATNALEVSVTNLSANRIRDLDVRGVPWASASSASINAFAAGGIPGPSAFASIDASEGTGFAASSASIRARQYSRARAKSGRVPFRVVLSARELSQ